MNQTTAPTATDLPHIPILRFGKEYRSLDLETVTDPASGAPLAEVSRANPGMIRRDLRKIREARRTLQQLSYRQRLKICQDAGDLFMNGSLRFGGTSQSAEDYIAVLSRTSGLPYSLIKKNMAKVHTVFTGMEEILRGLTRGLDLSILDQAIGEHNGVPVCYAPESDCLGVVLPSNSPGVNSIWMPSIALGIPVLLKPGREEPWTPMRIIQALLAAGCPNSAFGFYPTSHDGAATILDHSGRALLFGDESTTSAYAHNAAIQIHGPGWSKVLVGEDVIDSWEEFLPTMVQSVAANGGRSCINASSIFVPRHGRAIAEALAERCAEFVPKAADDPTATLSAFANPKFAEWINAKIDEGLQAGGAVDCALELRGTPRQQTLGGRQYLLPTVVYCDSLDHPLARTEFLFPFTSVVEVPSNQWVEQIGPTLVATVLTKQESLIRDLLDSRKIDRLNLGPVPTSVVEWNQPHEGNLFEFLYSRNSIQRASSW